MGALGSRYIMHLCVIQLFGCLGWLCNVALAQLEISERVTGSLNLPDIGITLMGNLAVFVTSLLRGRLDLEMGARDALATLRGPKLQGTSKIFKINKGFGLTTCEEHEDRFREASVVMLSYNTPNSSMRQFMEYICNANKVHSILLQCFPLKSKSGDLLHGICNHTHDDNKNCECIVFWNVEEIIMMLARRMPGKLKRLSDSLCLLPCPHCRDKGCHGCDQGQFVEEIAESGRKILTKDDMGSKIVKDIFHYVSRKALEEDRSCICIPLSPSGYDDWGRLLFISFGERENVHRVYSTASFLLPRLGEVLLNVALTGWFRVDGFSSSLVARKIIKDYVVNTQGSGFAASAFLIRTSGSPIVFLQKFMAKEGNGCQVLKFRGAILNVKPFAYMVGCVNLICSISWAVLVAFQGSFGKWYDTHSMPPSKSRVAVIMIAIGIALGMDCLHLYLSRSSDSNSIEIDRSRVKPTEPTVELGSKKATEPTVMVDSKESTKPTDPIVMVDSKESTKPTEPTVKVSFRPIVKVWSHLKVWLRLELWFHPGVKVLKMVWSRLKPWFDPVMTVLKMVWSSVEVWFRPVMTVLKTVWFSLKPRLAVVLKMVWSPLEVLFRPVRAQFRPAVKVLKGVWFRLKDWFVSAMKVLKMVRFHHRAMVWALIALEMVCILCSSIALGIFDIKFIGRWLYSALQVLVWIKWLTGSYLLGECPPEYDSEMLDSGIIVYSSAFLLNSILAGVRGDWKYSLSMKN